MQYYWVAPHPTPATRLVGEVYLVRSVLVRLCAIALVARVLQFALQLTVLVGCASTVSLLLRFQLRLLQLRV